MRQAVGVVLLLVGFGWAGVGAWSCQKAVEPTLADPSRASNVTTGVVGMISGLFFVLPGLMLAGIGAIAYGGGSKKQ